MKYQLKTDNAQIGMRLKKIRDHFGMNQRDFAARLGLATSSISEIESNNTMPSYGLIMKLQEEFTVNPNYLLLGIGVMILENVNNILDYDFGDQKRETIALVDLMDRSPLVRTMVLASAAQFIKANEALIKIDIEQREQAKKNRQQGK